MKRPGWTYRARRTYLCTKAIIRDDHGRVLLLRRSATDPRRPLTWDLPGGNVEWGEDPLGALTREVKEETGLELAIPYRILEVSSTCAKDTKARGRNKRKVYVVRMIFTVSMVPLNTDVTLSYEHDKFFWVSQLSDLDPVNDWAFDLPERYASVVREVLVS